MTGICERLQDVEGRLVPGDREGDLIMGAGHTAVGTLVERTTRFLLLVLMPTHKAAIPAPLRRTLTYDQGKETARHKHLATSTWPQAPRCASPLPSQKPRLPCSACALRTLAVVRMSRKP